MKVARGQYRPSAPLSRGTRPSPEEQQILIPIAVAVIAREPESPDARVRAGDRRKSWRALRGFLKMIGRRKGASVVRAANWSHEPRADLSREQRVVACVYRSTRVRARSLAFIC